MNKVEIGVQSLKQMGADILAAWNAAEQGNQPVPKEALYFSDMQSLLTTLTPARWKLLEVLKASGPLSVYALAKKAERHYSNVHTDVARLLELGLITRDEQQRIYVPWDEIHADFALRVAADEVVLRKPRLGGAEIYQALTRIQLPDDFPEEIADLPAETRETL